MVALNPDNRQLTLTGESGTTYVVTDMVLYEWVNGAIHGDLHLLAQEAISPDGVLGKPVSVKYKPDLKGDSQEFFHGVVLAVEQKPMLSGSQLIPHKFRLGCWFDLLDYCVNCRVFQQLGVHEIIEKILEDYPCEHAITFKTKPSSKRELCIQFNQSDGDFIRRLLFEEGLHYYFTQSDSGHEMVVIGAATDMDAAVVPRVQVAPPKDPGVPCVKNWFPCVSLGAAAVVTSGYSSEQAKPLFGKEVKAENLSGHGTLGGTHYWDERLIEKERLDGWSEQQSKRLEGGCSVVEVSSSLSSLRSGTTLEMSNHGDAEQNQEYVITRVEHRFSFPESSSGGGSASYYNEFYLSPSKLALACDEPDKVRISGVHTATVFNSDDEECAADAQGRVQVVFHWDKDQENPCWVQVSSLMAGNQCGLHLLPRTKQEVVVSYINGNPDAPLITGTVYNGANARPASEPDTIQLTTHSAPDGGAEDAHIFIINDKKDSEEFSIQAQKDMKLTVKNNLETTIMGEEKREIEKAVTLLAKDEVKAEVAGALQVTAKDEVKAEVAGALQVTAKDEVKTEVAGALQVTAKDAVKAEVAGALQVAAKDEAKLQVTGALQIEANEGTVKGKSKLQLEAPQGIVLKAGTSEIEIAPAGITIKGLKMQMEATTQLGLKGLMLQMEASTMAQLKADAMLMAKGGLTMVN